MTVSVAIAVPQRAELPGLQPGGDLLHGQLETGTAVFDADAGQQVPQYRHGAGHPIRAQPRGQVLPGGQRGPGSVHRSAPGQHEEVTQAGGELPGDPGVIAGLLQHRAEHQPGSGVVSRGGLGQQRGGEVGLAVQRSPLRDGGDADHGGLLQQHDRIPDLAASLLGKQRQQLGIYA